MGDYINPIEGTKEEYLTENAESISLESFKSFDDFDGDNVPVVLVNNGLFTAAGIMFNQKEHNCWVEILEEDFRPRNYFLISKEAACIASPSYERFLNKKMD